MNYKAFYRELIKSVTGSLPTVGDGMPDTEFDSLCKLMIPQALKDYYLVAGRHEINHGVFALFLPEQLKIEDGFLFFMEEQNGLMTMAVKDSEIHLENPMAHTALLVDDRLEWLKSGQDTISSAIAKLLKGVSVPAVPQEPEPPTVNVKKEWKKYIQKYLPQFTPDNVMIVPRGFLLYEWEAGKHTPFRFFLAIQTDPYDRNRFTFDLNWHSSPGENLGTLFSPLTAPDGAVRIGFLRHILSEKGSDEHYEDLWWKYEVKTDANGKQLPLESCIPSAVQSFDEWITPFYREMLQYMQAGIKTELLEKLDTFIRH